MDSFNQPAYGRRRHPTGGGPWRWGPSRTAEPNFGTASDRPFTPCMDTPNRPAYRSARHPAGGGRWRWGLRRTAEPSSGSWSRSAKGEDGGPTGGGRSSEGKGEGVWNRWRRGASTGSGH